MWTFHEFELDKLYHEKLMSEAEQVRLADIAARVYTRSVLNAALALTGSTVIALGEWFQAKVKHKPILHSRNNHWIREKKLP